MALPAVIPSQSADRGVSGLAVIGELRIPTGREDDLLGAGTTVFIGS